MQPKIYPLSSFGVVMVNKGGKEIAPFNRTALKDSMANG